MVSYLEGPKKLLAYFIASLSVGTRRERALKVAKLFYNIKKKGK